MANPKQYIITPNPDIDSRDNVESVSSEAGGHIGPCYPNSENEGAMVPFQETYGTFTETEIEYMLAKTGGIGSAEWVWRKKGEADDEWRGVGDIRNHTNLHNPFKEFEGKENCANLGMAAVVSKAHNRLLLFKRTSAGERDGAVTVAWRSLDEDNPTLPENWKTYEFRPSSYFTGETVNNNMWFVGACELNDGTLRMVGTTYDSDTLLWDLNLFGSDDGGLSWTLLQKNIIGRWYNQNDKMIYQHDVRRIHNLKMAASGSWIRIVWIGPKDRKFHTLISSDRGATWENPTPPEYLFMYQPYTSKDMWTDFDAGDMCNGSGGGKGAPHAGWYPWSDDLWGVSKPIAEEMIRSGGDDLEAFYNITSSPNGKSHPQEDIKSESNPGSNNYFDLVKVGGSEGSFALVFQARPNTSTSEVGGSNPARCTYIAGGVRDSPWGIARMIVSKEYLADSDSFSWGASGVVASNANQQRPLQQFCFTDTQVSAVATPSWLYIFIFCTPGQTGGTSLNLGWWPACTANAESRISEPFGSNNGFGAVNNDGRVAASPGPWGVTVQKSGWKGYRIPMTDPFGGSAQKLHVSDANGHLFPGAVGQGKMFVPSNVVLAWDGQRVVVFNGIGHNGALDAYSNGQTSYSSGPTGTVGIYGSPSERRHSMPRYGWSYYRNYWSYKTEYDASGKGLLAYSCEDLTDTASSYNKAFESWFSGSGLEGTGKAEFWGIAVHKGRGRRVSHFDAPLTFKIDKVDKTIYHASQESKGRGHCVVSTFGGWDTQPLIEQDGYAVGNLNCAPFFADTWQAQYGIPHYNFIGASWTGGGDTDPINYSPAQGWPGFFDDALVDEGSLFSATHLAGLLNKGSSDNIPNGSTLMGFNIIGESTPGPVDSDGLTYAAAFIDTAQAPAFGSDTGLLGSESYRLGYDYFCTASASLWTVRANRKYKRYAGFDEETWCDPSGKPALRSSWPWDRINRDMGNRTVDWESDRVTIRQNFMNKRTGLSGGNRDNMPIAFTTWRSGMGMKEMCREYVGAVSVSGFADSRYPALPASLWGCTPYLTMVLDGPEDPLNPRIGTTANRSKGYSFDEFKTMSGEHGGGIYANDDSLRYNLEMGRQSPLGNGGVVEFVCSVPHKGLRGSDKNPNKPEKHVTTSSGQNGNAGNWRLAAVNCRYYTEAGGYATGGNLAISEVCVAIGQATSSESTVAVLVDQNKWNIQDTSVGQKDVEHLATLDLGPDAMGTTDNPIFWKFRLILWQEGVLEMVKLLARPYGSSGAWQASGSFSVRSHALSSGSDFSNATQHEYKWSTSYGGEEKGYSRFAMQMCQWGKLDEQVTDDAWNGKYLSSDSYQGGSGSSSGTEVADHEYVSYWKEFNVSHPGTGGVWRQASFSNPTSLTGMVCSPTPTYVCTGIYARWGGGGGFVGDTFSGTVDHTYAVENIFRPSPSALWKSDDVSGSECSIVLSAFGSTTATVGADREYMRTYANWVAFYGIQDRKFLVDFSLRREFGVGYTATYEANSLITYDADVVSVAGTRFELSDPNNTIKDGQLAGCYAGWKSSATNLQCVRIKTNVYNADQGAVTVFVDIEDEDTVRNMTFPSKSLGGNGLSTSKTIDIWGDRCAINLYSSDQVRHIPSVYSDVEEFMDGGFAWMRIRFFATDAVTVVGAYEYDIKKKYWTIDGRHTIGHMMVGHGTEFETPINWSFTESIKPNVKIKTAPSGQKSAYVQGPARTSYSLSIPGDADRFRYKLSQLLRLNSEFSKKPVSLLISSESAVPSVAKDNAIRASKRYNVLARLAGAVSNRNIAWTQDANGVWHPVGDLSLNFEEEV
jgi:hypothetical protein